MDVLERAFMRIGARVKFARIEPRWLTGQRVPVDLALDVRRDDHGEYFLISRTPRSRPS